MPGSSANSRAVRHLVLECRLHYLCLELGRADSPASLNGGWLFFRGRNSEDGNIGAEAAKIFVLSARHIYLTKLPSGGITIVKGVMKIKLKC